MVRVPAVVDQVAAAAEVIVKAPLEVVSCEAALPCKVTAPPLVVIPALPVIRLEKVLAPARVWTPVVTRPAKEASALCRTRLLPTMTAPLAFLDWESSTPIVVTPLTETPPWTLHLWVVMSYLSSTEASVGKDRAAPVPVMMRSVAVTPVWLAMVAAVAAVLTKVMMRPSAVPVIELIVWAEAPVSLISEPVKVAGSDVPVVE
jgi:hypothetical protein